MSAPRDKQLLEVEQTYSSQLIQLFLLAVETVGHAPILALGLDMQVQPSAIAVFVASRFAAVLCVLDKGVGQCHGASPVGACWCYWFRNQQKNQQKGGMS